MKGIVLSGGKGSRLRPFTYSGAKQLVPVANIPVLHFPIRQLVEAGITEIAIVVGDTEPQIRNEMGDGTRFGARFTYVRQDSPAGIAHGALICRDFVGDDPFVLYLGDNVLVGGIRDFVSTFEASGADGAVVLRRVPDPRAFGVAVMDGERLVRVIEKPSEPPTDLAVIGVYAFRPVVFDVIASQRPSARGELEIADAINGLLERGLRVDTSVTAEEWIDTGKMEDMLAANRTILATIEAGVADDASVTGSCEGAVMVEAGAEVVDCLLRGPVAIGAGARVRGSTIGPNVAIGRDCRVEFATIENSIVMEETEIRDCPGIVDSMIGRFAHVSGAPAGARLTLGDHSRFEGAQ